MTDVLVMAKSFNSKQSDTSYNENADFNQDSSVNMEDIMIVAKHFNQICDNYLSINI